MVAIVCIIGEPLDSRVEGMLGGGKNREGREGQHHQNFACTTDKSDATNAITSLYHSGLQRHRMPRRKLG